MKYPQVYALFLVSVYYTCCSQSLILVAKDSIKSETIEVLKVNARSETNAIDISLELRSCVLPPPAIFR